MTDRTALAELIEKVERGEAPERIATARALWIAGGRGSVAENAVQSLHVLRAYEGSLDAAKALHEAVLPGWFWNVSGGTAGVMNHDGSDDFLNLKHFDACQPGNPARAWLLSILRALHAQETHP